MSNIKTVVNHKGQTVLVPSFLQDSWYQGYLFQASASQFSLLAGADKLNEIVNLNKKLKPRILGVLPAITEVIFRTFKENAGRKDKFGEFVAISFHDIKGVLIALEIDILVNDANLRKAFNNVVTVTRTETHREIGLSVYNDLQRYDIYLVPHYTGERGGPIKGYYFN